MRISGVKILNTKFEISTLLLRNVWFRMFEFEACHNYILEVPPCGMTVLITSITKKSDIMDKHYL